ncbi:MAG: LPS export ABC transporter permease LptF [Gammaproteobacteria bacterium]|nr:LPS export ABC transporter permease LptF [Gammaproteobacteria bacterium]
MILQRYLVREILQSAAAVLGILVLIYASSRFARFLSDAAAGLISGDLIFQLLILKISQNLELLLPVSIYFGVLIGLGRLYKDSEIVAMLASGVGIRNIYQGVIWIGVAFALITLALSLYAAPRIATEQAKLLARAKGEAEISGIIPGRFRELSGGDRVFYAEQLSPDRRTMRNVFVQVRRSDRQEIAVARRAYLSVQGREGDRFVVLEDGYRYTGHPGAVDYVITRFEKHAVRIADRGDDPEYRKLESLPSLELLQSGQRGYIAELQWRLSLPLSVIVLCMLAVPLSRTSPRQGKYAKLFTAVIIYFIYNNGIGVAQKLVERGELHPWVGVWPVHVAVALVAIAMLWTQNTLRWRRILRLEPEVEE